MKRALVLALLLLCGCSFAVKHPAITAGIVAGSVAMITCELASEDHKKCGIAAGAVGVGLALVAAGALWLGSEDEEPAKDEPPPKIDWSKVPDTTPKEPTKAPPRVPVTPPALPPALPPADAGVPVESPPPPVPSVPVDAGTPDA